MSAHFFFDSLYLHQIVRRNFQDSLIGKIAGIKSRNRDSKVYMRYKRAYEEVSNWVRLFCYLYLNNKPVRRPKSGADMLFQWSGRVRWKYLSRSRRQHLWPTMVYLKETKSHRILSKTEVRNSTGIAYGHLVCALSVFPSVASTRWVTRLWTCSLVWFVRRNRGRLVPWSPRFCS